MFMRENNESEENICTVCGCIVVACRCYLDNEYNRMSKSVFSSNTASVKTRDGHIMMTVEQYKALCGYMNIHSKLPIKKITTNYIMHIMTNCIVSP